MIGIKINKIAAVWLLGLVVEIGYASQGEIFADREIASTNLTFSNMPRVGHIFTVTYTITPRIDSSREYMYPYVVQFVINTSQEKEAYKIVEGNLEYPLPVELKKNVPVTFSISLLITKQVPIVQINANIPGHIGWFRSLQFYLIDPQTGQYGTKEEYEGKLPVEYRYDPLVGTFTCSPSQNPAPVEENREIIKMIKKLAPTLSDSLALVLHSEQYRVGIPKGLPRWDSLNQRWKEEEIFEYYLKDGWLDALNRNELQKWEEKERIKIQTEHKEKKSQFFRGGSGDSDSIDSGVCLVAKTFYGQWRYKNHYYNKDQGLLADAKRDTVKHCRARCLIRYTEGSTTYYSYFNQKCITDNNGYFFITINVNPNWTACRVYPVLFPAGPDLNNPVINVSDPNITIPNFWKDPDDPTLYIMREDGTGVIHPFTPDTNTLFVGYIWTDTFPLYTQPHSGCINIYETYLQARTFMSPPPSWPLRVI